MSQMHGDKMNCAARLREFLLGQILFRRKKKMISFNRSKRRKQSAFVFFCSVLAGRRKAAALPYHWAVKNVFMAHGSVRDF
jgi:hypothetical protein